MNDHLTTLKILVDLSKSDTSSAVLCSVHGVSIATLKRFITEARHMGAVVESRKVGSVWLYHLDNWAQIKKIVTSWMTLEENRSLV